MDFLLKIFKTGPLAMRLYHNLRIL